MCFCKLIGLLLLFLWVGVGDGFFIVYQDELNWGKVYCILLLVFSQCVMKGYFDVMFEVVNMLVDKWVCQGLDVDIFVVDDMMWFMFDIILLVGFGYCFDLFNMLELYLFLVVMVGVLFEVMGKFMCLLFKDCFMCEYYCWFEYDVVVMY